MKSRLFLVAGFFFFLFSHTMAQVLPALTDPALPVKIEIDVNDSGISLHVENGDIKDVLAELSRKTGVVLTAGPQISAKINLDMKGVDLEQILKKICASRAVVYTRDPETGAYTIVSGFGFDATHENTTSDVKSGSADLFSSATTKTSPIITTGSVTMPVNGFFVDKNKYDAKGRLLYKPGELLVKLKKDILTDDTHKLHTTLGSRVLETIKGLRLQRIALKKGLDEDAAAILYMQSGLVDIVEKNALRYKNAEPDDPLFSEQWGMTMIQAPETWDIATGSATVVVAVIDTGVDYTHPDLVDNIWTNTAELNGVAGKDDDDNGYVDDVYGWDFAGDGENEDNDPLGDDSHGTHVAGIIAARGNNGIGVAGVCWNLKIMPVKVEADGASSMEDFDILQGMQYAMENDARVINCSYGGGSSVVSEKDMLSLLGDQGILAVCAAGNDGETIDGLFSNNNYPAQYDLANILAVASNDKDGEIYTGSNYGLTSVDVMAPGVWIKSTVLSDSYGNMSGTSMATPHVTGLAGLLLSLDPGLGYAGLKSIIMDTVDPVDGAMVKLVSGGRVNAFAAVSSVCIDEFDCDNDGMEDSWEKVYFGSTWVTDGTGDSDHDGYADLQEFINHTDPWEQNDPGDEGYDPATDDLSISGSVNSNNENAFVTLVIAGEIVDTINIQTARENDFKFNLSSDPEADTYTLTAVDNDAYSEITVAGTFLPITGADIDLASVAADLVHLTFDDDFVYEATAYTNGSDFIFAITAEDGAGSVTEFPNSLILTLPFNLRQVATGEFESGDVTIYHADTRSGLLAGEGAAVPVEDIIAVDYIGDGQTGWVTFRVYSLSVFGIGVKVDDNGDGGSGGGGGCYISTVAKIPDVALSAASLILTGFDFVFSRIIRFRDNR
jgi:subtilisin family serine protease